MLVEDAIEIAIGFGLSIASTAIKSGSNVIDRLSWGWGALIFDRPIER
jgi:hypothetical protein